MRLRVSAGAKASAFKGLYGESRVPRLSVAAPPVDGKANAEVERFLSVLLDLPKSDVCVVGGLSGRDKTFLLRGVEPDQVRARFDALL